ncbi:MAG: chemotaxis protein CheC [Candidatus Bathyarchaeia archaeon]|jgi:chemotaxis protein CheC
MSKKPLQSFCSVSDIDILTELGSIGAGNATVALSKIIQEPIKIEVPTMHLSPPHLVPSIYDKHDTVVTAIFMQLRGDADCDIMLIFDAQEAAKIAGIMAHSADCEKLEIQQSAIEELGSIMICSFLSAMGDFTGTELIPSPPIVLCDCFDAVIDSLLLKQALCSDLAVIFDARFKRSESAAEGFLITFPSDKLRRMLADKGKKWLLDCAEAEKAAIKQVP